MPVEFELVSLADDRVYPIESPEFLVGRSPQAQLRVFDLGCSRQQFRIVLADRAWHLEPLSGAVATVVDEQAVPGRTPLADGMTIQAGECRFRVRRKAPVPEPESVPHDEPVPRGLPTMAGDAVLASCPQGHGDGVWPSAVAGLATVPIPVGAATIIGREAGADVRLDHIQVSRRHARLRHSGNRVILQDLGSANGTFVDGRRIVMPEVLKLGARIGIGPYSLTFMGDALVPASRTNNLQLEGWNLTCVVPDRRAPEGRRILLDDVTVVIRPHEFVCLLGPTGAGKTTLLSALSASVPANQGHVLVNQNPLYEDFDSLRHDIAVVPQRDILHEGLSLESALRYTARLRLPADTTRAEIESRISELLAAVGLTEQRTTKIRSLSGGQRRRASLANELLANPSLLFLDEVTAGLDEQTDRGMMRLFRAIADAGKTVVCVTHSLANVAESCHLVVLLAAGGQLVFVGTPDEAREYFQVERLSDVYEKLADKGRAAARRQQFLESPHYQRYVELRRSSGPVRRQGTSAGGRRNAWREGAGTAARQLPVLMARYARTFAADSRALLGLILQCLIVAVVLYLVFGDVIERTQDPFHKAAHASHVLFVLGMSCFWFGCNNAVKEIVKERAIYTQELRVNLDPFSYYASKFLLQFVAAGVQSLLLLAAVAMWCRVPGATGGQAQFLLLAAAAGVATGLFLSAVSTTEEMALTLVPLVLIPQIILSDVFLCLEGVSRWLGRLFVTNYWIFGAIRGTLPQDWMQYLSAPLPAPPRLAVLAVAAHLIVLSGIAIVVLHVRDRVMASSNKTWRQAVSELALVRALAPRFGRG